MEVLSIDNFEDFIFKGSLYTKMTMPEDNELPFFPHDYFKKLYCPYCELENTFKLAYDNTVKAHWRNYRVAKEEERELNEAKKIIDHLPTNK
jgi:hypothetical protein